MREKTLLDGLEEPARDVIGLTLQLQKFSVGTPSHVRHVGGNTVLGHYDHLLINPVRKWLDFSPRMDWKYSEDSNFPGGRGHLVSHYPIKLLFPSREIIGSQPDFAYTAWKDPEKLLADKPCMTVALLNLTDAYRKQEGGQLLPNFLRLLRENCREQLNQMRCCVLPSLGYSDFCILMADSGWKAALELVDRLHGMTVADAAREDGKVVVLSTDYMLPVCHRSDKREFCTYFDGLKLMVRVNLCPGITARHLANSLPKVQVYRISGGSDCFLSAQDREGQQALMDFLLDDGTGNFVVDIVSTPHLMMMPGEPDPAAPEWPLPDQEYMVRFENAIRAYSHKMEMYHRHIRQINALWELLSMIKNICSQHHTGDLRRIMRDLLESFSYCLECCADQMDDNWDFADMEECVGMFSGVVGEFLSDLSCSDCFFMERDRYNHASVSSATSLLIAYNHWLNEFTWTVSKITESQNRSKYTFLVTSGGRDQTQTMEAFYFLDQKLEENGQLYEEVPLVTQMSEMSLFDFSGTILRATHECMHFSGIRRRRERVGYLLTFLIRLLSKLLTNALLSEESVLAYAKGVFQSLHTGEDVLEEAEKAYHNRWRELFTGIAEKLEEFLKPPIEEWNEWNCLSKNVQDWLHSRLMWVFSGQTIRENGGVPYRFHMNGLAEALYQLTQAAQRDYFEDCDQLCHAHKLDCAVFSYGAKTQRVFKQQDKIDETLDTAIQLILSRLLIEEVASAMPAAKDEPDYGAWELNFPYFSLISNNIKDILVTSVDIFKEAFADVIACEILGADLADYVLMHVFEDWDLDSALSMDIANTYRIPAVLRLCFGDCLDDGGQLTREARGRIEKAVQRLELHGMPHRLDSGELCDRLDNLLCEFHKSEEIGAPLLTYLGRCKADYEQEAVKSALEPFTVSYRTIRLLSIDPKELDCHEKLLAMYDALTSMERRLPTWSLN